MYAYRYEKVWVFTATLPFAAFLFSPNTLASNCRFLKNFSNGILLSFALVTFFCLAHRPHHYWMLYRYGGIFHTVACTGMYLAVVFGTALAKLYGKLKDTEEYADFLFSRIFCDHVRSRVYPAVDVENGVSHNLGDGGNDRGSHRSGV